MSSNSGITIKGQGGQGEGSAPKAPHSHTTSSNSNASKIDAASFAKRAQQYAISDKDCAEANRENFASRGGATIRMYPVCAPNGGAGEDFEIHIGCGDLNGDISISPSIEEGTIASQCPGEERTKIDGYMVEITIPMMMDKLMANPALLRALHQGEPVATSTDANGRTYEAFGISKEIFKSELPRFYVEIIPTEQNQQGAVTSMLFFPYAMLFPLGGSLSFGKTTDRVIEIRLKATMPPSSQDGTTPVVSGIWRAVA
jgi:hypothetical protein